MQKYENGAIRSEKKPRYRDVSLSFLRRIANAFGLGAARYEKDMLPWEKNWKRGDLLFALEVLDHAEEHLQSYKESVLAQLNGEDVDPNEEDHLGHLGANLVMLDYFEEKGFWNPASYEFVEEPATEPGPLQNEAEGPGQLQLDFETPEKGVATKILEALGLK